MENIITNIVSIIDGICSLLIFDTFFAKRNTKYRTFKNFVIIFSVFVASNIINYIFHIFAIQNSLFRVLLYLVFYFTLASCIYSGNYRMKLYISTGFYLLAFAIDYYVLMFANLLPNKIDIYYLELLSRAILFIVVIFIKIKITPESLRYVTNRLLNLILSLTFFTLIIMVLLFNLSSSYEITFISLGFLCILIIMMISVCYIVTEDNKRRELSLSKEKIANTNQTIDYSLQTKKMIHNINNHMICLKEYIINADKEKSLAYIKSIMTSTTEIQAISTNCNAVNAIISNKFADAYSKDIAIISQIGDMSDIFLTDEDIVILLGNLLDNAIESCERVIGKRIIYFKFIIDPEYLVISIRNSVSKKIEIINNFIPSLKGDSEFHGYGLMSVLDIADKYGGIYNFDCDENNFTVTVLVPK